jgi:hypothetical protein
MSRPLRSADYRREFLPVARVFDLIRCAVMTYLFTIIAFFAVVGVALFANRRQRFSSDNVQINAKYVRQELRVIAYLRAGVVILLGVIADKIQ